MDNPHENARHRKAVKPSVADPTPDALAGRGRVPLPTPHILAADPTVHLPKRFDKLGISPRLTVHTPHGSAVLSGGG